MAISKEVPRSCSSCEAWGEVNSARDDLGECRRNPPTLLVDSDDRWPVTTQDDWCMSWNRHPDIVVEGEE